MNVGKQGKPLDVIANFYKIDMIDMVGHHYDVTIEFDSGEPDEKLSRLTLNDGPKKFNGGNVRGFLKQNSTKIFEKFCEVNKEALVGSSPCFNGVDSVYTCRQLDLQRWVLVMGNAKN